MPASTDTPVPRWTDFLAAPRFRPTRVLCLLAAVVVLSLADLYMTLVHLLHFGMLEANPLARAIMEYGSPAALIIWKLLTVGLAVGILFAARARRTAEWAAAFCCLTLVCLTGRWISYNIQVAAIGLEIHEARHDESSWVSMTEDP
jgi:hypothetical protein